MNTSVGVCVQSVCKSHVRWLGNARDNIASNIVIGSKVCRCKQSFDTVKVADMGNSSCAVSCSAFLCCMSCRDPTLTTIVTLLSAYSSYYTADRLVGASGLLAVVMNGFTMSIIGEAQQGKNCIWHVFCRPVTSHAVPCCAVLCCAASTRNVARDVPMHGKCVCLSVCLNHKPSLDA